MVLFGPSSGRWYAGSPGLGSLVLRAVGGVMLYDGTLKSDRAQGFDCLGLTDAECETATARNQSELRRAELMLLSGLGTILATTLFDTVMAGVEASRSNRERALQLGPTLYTSAGNTTVGIRLLGRF